MDYENRELKRSIMKLESMICDIYDALDIPPKICPICESRIRLFTPAGEELRPNAKCPVCGSYERTRAWYLYYLKKCIIPSNRKIKILHFAPERQLMPLFTENNNIDYYPVDYNNDYYGIRDVVDITDIPYDSDQCDVIICNHVLEHISEEKKALSECYRVLKQDGVFLLSVPFFDIEKTLENPEYNTDELRSKYYGQKDHVRKYGLDVKEHLCGIFDVEEIDCIKELSLDAMQIKKFGLMEKEIIWKLVKH